LPRREINFAQEPVEARSHFRLPSSSHDAFVFENLGCGLLLSRGRLDHQAKHGECRNRPLAKQSREHGPDFAHCSLLPALRAIFSKRDPETYALTFATERNARSSPLMTRVFPAMMILALDRMSLELLPALISTGPGSMMTSPARPV